MDGVELLMPPLRLARLSGCQQRTSPVAGCSALALNLMTARGKKIGARFRPAGEGGGDGKGGGGGGREACLVDVGGVLSR